MSDAPASSGKAGMHAGATVTTKANAFETVLLPDGIRIYRYTMQWNPRFIDDAYGKIEIQFPDGPKSKLELQRRVLEDGDQTVWFCPMHASVIRPTSGSCPICGMALAAQDFLFAPIDLSTYSGSELDGMAFVVKVEMRDLGDPEEHAKFTQRGLAVTDLDASATRLGSSEEERRGERPGMEHVH